MPRLPKNFEIAWVSIDELAPGGYLSTGPNTAIPNRFQANFQLENPPAAVVLEVFVGADLRPVAISVKVQASTKTPVTTSVMRQILIDQLVQRAVEEATVPASKREEWLATLPPGAVQPTDRSDAAPSADQRTRTQADDDARRAALIYAEAVSRGNRAPAVAVANVMNRSRTQVARYIRRARELGILSPLGETEGD
ncbi:hypothetical protein [Lentzea sp. NBRC 102530]|uniref:hypothetical protein n=1 Tax=Lentzea sp. NBRC 102530 TaxID=3032201 RepID=UPI0024A3FABB|nr:hypothetical protein [Lentzea sp. NBRC 102530]GLY55009.1 hypothetical protein Lesp01_86640 [Lentzea sp. NBRC 102530]